MQKTVWALLIGVVCAAATGLWLGQRSAAPQGVVLIGDHAPVLARAVGLPSAGGRGAVTVATVNTWVQLNYLQGLGALCDSACSDDAWLVRVLEPRPGGSRKTVFLRLGVFGDGDLWPPVPACLRAVIVAEMSSLGAAEMPDCVRDLPSPQTRTLLPFGFGAI